MAERRTKMSEDVNVGASIHEDERTRIDFLFACGGAPITGVYPCVRCANHSRQSDWVVRHLARQSTVASERVIETQSLIAKNNLPMTHPIAEMRKIIFSTAHRSRSVLSLSP